MFRLFLRAPTKQHESLDRDVQCPLCNAKFLDERWLRFHKKVVHQSEDCTPEHCLLNDVALNPSGLTCPCCHSKFSGRKSLLQHARTYMPCAHALKWLWEQRQQGYDPPVPLVPMPGRARALLRRKEIPNKWRNFMISVQCNHVLAAARKARQSQHSIVGVFRRQMA